MGAVFPERPSCSTLFLVIPLIGQAVAGRLNFQREALALGDGLALGLLGDRDIGEGVEIGVLAAEHALPVGSVPLGQGAVVIDGGNGGAAERVG